MEKVALGIDCGFAYIGVALISGTVEDPKCLYATTVFTRAGKKGLERKSIDDARRLNHMYGAVEDLVGEFAPHVAGLEYYTPLAGKSHSAGKVAMCFGILWGLCKAHRIPAYSQLPIDVKSGVLGVKSASKGAIIKTIRHFIPTIDPFLERQAASHHEHMADAAAHAVLALRAHTTGVKPHT